MKLQILGNLIGAIDDIPLNCGLFRTSVFAVVCGLALAFPLSLQATTVWTDWTETSVGSPGSASGTMDGVTVSYAGEVLSGSGDGNPTIWLPESTFSGGVVDTPPVGDIIYLGATNVTGTISFSSPVANPVIAIWSLGSQVTNTFTFTQTPTLVVGGPGAEHGGSSITVDGNTVTGTEGYGIIIFEGAFSSINFTSTAEFQGYYGFTVGSVQAVPIPAAVWLFGSGLLGLTGIARRKKVA